MIIDRKKVNRIMVGEVNIQVVDFTIMMLKKKGGGLSSSCNDPGSYLDIDAREHLPLDDISIIYSREVLAL